MKIKQWLQEFFSDLISKTVVQLIVGGSIILIFWSFIFRIITTKASLPIGILIDVLLLGFLIGIQINKAKRGTYFFQDFVNLTWKIDIDSLKHVKIETVPYCKKCKTRYVRNEERGTVILICPNPECKDSQTLSYDQFVNQRQAAKNLAEREIREGKRA